MVEMIDGRPVVKVDRNLFDVMYLNDPSPASHGHLEILEVTKILERASIPSCIFGIAALKYYNAAQLQIDWEICIPPDTLSTAVTIIESDPTYESVPGTLPRLWTIIHTYPRFRLKGINLTFILLPSDSVHFECIPENIERSHKGLPYPKLVPFAQSLLESFNRLHLTDLIDGMNLSLEWGHQNLDLSGTQDIPWRKRMNIEVNRVIPDPDEARWCRRGERGISKKETYEEIVEGKERRIGVECPKELFATRYCTHNDGPDPLVEYRHMF